ncbi:MAG: endo alpha-1,4 polygalactosaminidase [Saprospiraceae bacterium]
MKRIRPETSTFYSFLSKRLSILKKIFFAAIVFTLFISCNKDEPNNPDMDFRQAMREFVIGISGYAKGIKPGFMIIPQNGIELVSVNGEENGLPHIPYLSSIDGIGQEDLLYGYNNDDQATPTIEKNYLRAFLDIAKEEGKTILVTDYVSTHGKVDDSYVQNNMAGYISFAAPERELTVIPAYPNPLYHENNNMLFSLNGVSNFLYLINTEQYPSKIDFIHAVTATNYDLLIMDLFFDGSSSFTIDEINQLKNKANGGKRLVVSYLSIGEAEDYRYYWQPAWSAQKPTWMDEENPAWQGNYKVNYWNTEWQSIIFGNDNSYLKKIVDAGFDGIYLDIIDAFEYYE